MSDHLIFLLYGALAAILTALVGVIATRVRVLPDVIDLSFVPTGSGIASLILVFYGALRRFDPDRIARLALLGTLLGGMGTAALVLVALLVDVLSQQHVRALTPYLLTVSLVLVAAGVAYGLGAPAWLAYAAVVLAVLAVVPGYDRWDRRQHPR